jgi:hypothetical protein
MKSLVLLFVLVFGSLFTYGQKFQNVDFSVEGDVLIVKYSIVNAPSKSFYDVKLKFIDKNGKTIQPINVEGDLKRVIPGDEKKIQWNFTTDVDNLETEMKAVLEIDHSYTSKIKGGPENVILSMLWPGLGDHFVNPTDKLSPYFIQVLFAGAVGYGLYQKSQSDNAYLNYRNTRLQSEMDAQYEIANSANQQFMYCLAGAGAIWLFDVIHVLRRGSINVREQKKKNGLTYLERNLKFSFVPDPRNFQVMLTKKF